MPKLSHSFGYELRPKAPFDFELTVRKPAGWSLFTQGERYRRTTLWTATYLGGRLAGIKLASQGTISRPRIAVRVFLARRAPRIQVDRMKEQLNVAIGGEDELESFYAMADKDRILRHTVRHLRGMHDTSSCTIFSEACLAILLQMAPLARSRKMTSAFITTYGEVAEFDRQRIRAWPGPRRIARLRASELARRCKIGYRAKYIVALARRIDEGSFPSPEELRALPPAAAKQRLLELPGIGDYSADIINPHGGFPIDAWSVEVFSKLFFGTVPVRGRDAILKVKREGVRRWGRWAWMAFFYIVQDLPRLSKELKMDLRLA
jgi:3-methyladenine DNA glycosylase/8-oxoguanine DNA glycosylase